MSSFVYNKSSFELWHMLPMILMHWLCHKCSCCLIFSKHLNHKLLFFRDWDFFSKKFISCSRLHFSYRPSIFLQLYRLIDYPSSIYWSHSIVLSTLRVIDTVIRSYASTFKILFRFRREKQMWVWVLGWQRFENFAARISSKCCIVQVYTFGQTFSTLLDMLLVMDI